jgi:hypothetical protein
MGQVAGEEVATIIPLSHRAVVAEEEVAPGLTLFHEILIIQKMSNVVEIVRPATYLQGRIF